MSTDANIIRAVKAHGFDIDVDAGPGYVEMTITHEKNAEVLIRGRADTLTGAADNLLGSLLSSEWIYDNFELRWEEATGEHQIRVIHDE